MSYLDSMREMLTQPVFRYVFVGLTWLLLAAAVAVLAVIVVQFIANIGAAKRTGGVRKTRIPEALVLLAVVLGFWFLARWMLSQSV